MISKTPTIILLATFALLYLGCQQQNIDSITLNTGPHLFIDDFLIEDQYLLNRTINNPTKLPDPIVWSGWNKDQQWQPYLSVIFDEERDIFRMWYNTPIDTIETSRCHIGYMESKDGINWIRPHRVLEDPHKIQFGVSVVDRGKYYVKPNERYILGTYLRPGFRISTSPDGFDWTLISDKPVFLHNHDISSFHWDPIRQHYIAIASNRRTGYEDKSHFQQNDDRRRIPHQNFSKDLINWGDIQPIFEPKVGVPIEQGETQFYAMSGITVRGDLLIGLVKILRDDLNATYGKTTKEMGDLKRKAAGIGYTVLAWSRDGVTWQRDHEPFLDRNPVPGTFDHAMAWGDEQIVVGNETYIYYAGYERGHKINRFNERHTGFASMLRDRYVSRDADLFEGFLITKPLVLNGNSITVNANVFGDCRVRLLDAERKPIEGYDWIELRGDSITHTVKWDNNLDKIKGKPVRLEFKMKKTQLFSFDLL
ncbi:hypothetical protein ACFL46_01740 [Candidatus Neomarinimicrobiota bacterium]